MARSKAPKRQAALSKSAEGMVKKGWKPIERKPIQKWEAGKVVVGVLKSLRHGRFGPLVSIEVAKGEIQVYGAPTVLAERLESFEPEDDIYIECLGKSRGQDGKGNESWQFTVLKGGAKGEA